MTVTTTYPGVYIREIPSGVRTITGVATSITAFIGRASRGPVNEPVPIAGFGDFERTFGGLQLDCGLGYAVRDFYLNGGSDALIVRVTDTAATTARIDVDGLTLEAAGPGAWANVLEVEVEYPASADAIDVAAAQGVAPEDLFKLVIREGSGDEAPSETYVNVTKRDGPRRVDLVLAGSALARVVDPPPTPGARPAAGLYLVAGLDVDGLHLFAKDPALWAVNSGIEAKVTHPAEGDQAAIDAATAQSVTVADLFTLELTVGGTPEPKYDFVTVGPRGNRVDLALTASASTYVGQLPDVRPAAATYKAYEATDPVIGIDGGIPTSTDYVGSEAEPKTGIHALLKADLFNLLCIPPPTPAANLAPEVWTAAAAFCTARRAFLIVDPPTDQNVTSLPGWVTGVGELTGSTMRNAALYFPRICRSDPLRGGAIATFAACGAIAGTFARIDGSRGVWKAPAGTDAGLTGVTSLAVPVTDAENGRLNPLGINCLRTFRGRGSVVWGARTLRGSDAIADESKYVPVRRLTLFLEESLYRNTQWVVFEPNDEPLWAQIRASINAFMHDLFRRGAFQGISPRDAYFVRCDKDTTTQYDIDRGMVNIIVGFAPLKPAEFVIVSIQQKTASATA